MDENYKKFAEFYSVEGQKKFYSKIKKMRKDLEGIANIEIKKSIQENIEKQIKSYERGKINYLDCVISEKKIKESNNLNKKLGIELFNKKIKFLEKAGFMYRDSSDDKFQLPKN